VKRTRLPGSSSIASVVGGLPTGGRQAFARGSKPISCKTGATAMSKMPVERRCKSIAVCRT
jgi:hypothetical protein